MARDDFDEKTKEILRRRVNGYCSNPDCRISTQCASKNDSQKIEYIGVAAHICAASKGGPRYNPNQTSEERRNINNGIYLCTTCATKIDRNSGIDYPEELLREWKRKAEQKSREEFQYRIFKEGWKEIEFNNLENDCSAALLGLGLNQKYVKSCPRFEVTISEVKKYLNLSHNCCLYGISGSGKSITAFQIAYDYFKNGYTILKLKSDYNEEKINIPKENKLMLIIDNAQNYNVNLIEDICSKTNSNILALFVSTNELYLIGENGKNDSLMIRIDNPIKTKSLYYVDINIKNAINAISDFYISNKDKILDKVKKLDESIGENWLDESIESRIKRASKEQTPWQFNYVLTGGWKNAKKDLESAKIKNRADILILIIAVYQIYTLDKGITTEELKKEIIPLKYSSEWLHQSLQVLKSKNLLFIENNEIKLKHIEHARRSLKTLESEKNEEIFDFFTKNIKSKISNINSKKRIFALLCSLCYYATNFFYLLIRNENNNIEKLIKNLINEDDYDEYNIYIVNLFLQYSRNKFTHIIKSNKELIKIWILNINDKTAFSLYNILNSFINEGLHKSKNFLTFNVEFAKRISDIISNKKIGEELSAFSNFFGRLRFFVSEEFVLAFSNGLNIINYKLLNYNDLYHYSTLYKNIFVNNEFMLESFNKNKENMISLFNKDCILFHDNSHEIFYYLFSFGPLDIKTNREQKEIAKNFLQGLNVTTVSNRMNTVAKRDIKSMANILQFVHYIHKQKFNDIIKKLDFNHIEKLMDFNDRNFDVTLLNIISLSSHGKENARNIYARHLESINNFESKSCYFMSDLIVQEIKKNPHKSVNLRMSCISWESALSALYKVFTVDKSIAEKIFIDNISDIQKAIYLPQKNGLNKALEFLEFVDKYFLSSKLLFNNLNLNEIKTNWSNRIQGTAIEKKAVKKLIQMAYKSNSSLKEFLLKTKLF